MARWWAPVFEVGAGLCDAFTRAALDDIPCVPNGLRWPYDAWYLHLDAHPRLQGILCTRAGGFSLLNLFPNGWTLGVGNAMQWDHEVWAQQGGSLDAYIQHLFRHSPSETDEDNATHQEHLHLMGDAVSLVAQVLYYLNQPDREPLLELDDPRRKKLRREAHRFAGTRRGELAEEELRTFSRAQVTRLASTWERELSVAQQDLSSSASFQGGARAASWVRAHWRHYWVGSGEERKRELRFVLPHPRRGSDGELPNEGDRRRAYKLS